MTAERNTDSASTCQTSAALFSSTSRETHAYGSPLSPRNPLSTATVTGSTCACGRPIFISKTNECQRCYHRRWAAEHPRPWDAAAQVPCAACGLRPAERNRDICGPCRVIARRPDTYRRPCSYSAAHNRVRAARGPASNWRCAECGRRAAQWAYVGGAADEIEGLVSKGRGRRPVRMRWSPDPAQYRPMCARCHGLSTRPDWGAGYRKDPELARERRQQRRRAQQRPSPEGNNPSKENAQ